jgi:hypothetical protein
VTARYEERAEDALYAFLGNATTGIAARCAAINTDMSETDYPLPGVGAWTTYQRARSRKLNPPLYAVIASPAVEEDDRREYQGIFIVDCTVDLVIGVPSHRSNPTAMQVMRNRAARAVRECIMETDNWDGHTLGDATGILDAKINGKPTFLDLEKAKKRAIAVRFPVRVKVVELRAITA